MRRILILAFIMTFVCPAVLYGQGQNTHKKFVVVIDPGHGGKDPGAIATDPETGKLVLEKDIVLATALKLRNLIASQMSDVTTIMTRETDVFVTLDRRAKIANEAHADLFISIHVNAVDLKKYPQWSSSRGVRVIVMGSDTGSEEDNMTALRENASIKLEDNYETIYANYSADSPESKIYLQLIQFNNVNQSWALAEAMQRYCQKHIPAASRSRMVSSAYLYVLRNTAMPSVLVELGFLTNADDLKALQTDDYLNSLAEMLFASIKEYKSSVQNNVSHGTTTVPIQSAQPVQNTQVHVTNTQQPTEVVVTLPAPEVMVEYMPVETYPVHTTTQPTTHQYTPAETGMITAPINSPMFYVQVSAIRVNKPINSRDFKSYAGKVVMRQIDGLYKYFVGGVPTYEQGVRLLTQVRREFPDAFLVAFLGEQQIPLAEARQRQ